MTDQSGNRGVVFESLEGRALMSSTISGTVFSEVDADGHRESGEAGKAGVVVYIDANFDGKRESNEQATVSASDGSYSFTGLGAGVEQIRMIVPSGFRQTSPALAYYSVTTEGAEMHVANDFGLTSTAIVRGTVFNDTNHNGVKDTMDNGIAGVLVFIDKNKNGKLDAGEKSRYTDSSGNYRFRGLTAGNYTIRIAPGTGYTVSAPAGPYKLKLIEGQSLSNRNFGLFA